MVKAAEIPAEDRKPAHDPGAGVSDEAVLFGVLSALVGRRKGAPIVLMMLL